MHLSKNKYWPRWWIDAEQSRSLLRDVITYACLDTYFWHRSPHMPHHNPYTFYFYHDDVIKWKHFPRYWPFVWGFHRSPVNSPHKGQWRGALMFSFICAWINGWINNREAVDLRRHRAHYDVIVMRKHQLFLDHYGTVFAKGNQQHFFRWITVP